MREQPPGPTPQVRSWFAAMAAPTETAVVASAPQVVMVTTARLDSAAPVHRLAGTIRARTETDLGFRIGGKLLAAGRGRRQSRGRRRGGDARRHRPDAAARGGGGGAVGGADRAGKGRGRPQPRDDAGEEGLGQRPGQRRADRRRGGAARAAAAGGAQRRAGAECAFLCDLAGRRGGGGDRDLCRGRAGSGARAAGGEIARSGEPEAVVSVPEALVGAIAGASAEAELWSKSGHSFPVVLRELSPVADLATRTYEAHFTHLQ